MMIRKTLFAASIALLLAPTIANAGEEFAIRGVGNSSCGKYVRDPDLRKFALQWVGGYTTGINQTQSVIFAGQVDKFDSLKGADGDAIEVWMMNYCTQNPLKTVREAASELVRQ